MDLQWIPTREKMGGCTVAPHCKRTTTHVCIKGEPAEIKKALQNMGGKITPDFVWKKWGRNLEMQACSLHVGGIDNFWDNRILEKPKYLAYGEHDQVIRLDCEETNLDLAVRTLKKRGRFARLYAEVPAVFDWGNDGEDPKIRAETIRLAWTNGYDRFEFVDPRIDWGQEFRLVNGKLKQAIRNHGSDVWYTSWLGKFC